MKNHLESNFMGIFRVLGALQSSPSVCGDALKWHNYDLMLKLQLVDTRFAF